MSNIKYKSCRSQNVHHKKQHFFIAKVLGHICGFCALCMYCIMIRLDLITFLALASRAGNFKKLLAQTFFYLTNMKYNNDLFNFGNKTHLPAGVVHLKLYLPFMKITRG